jgi:hypothetical protein
VVAFIYVYQQLIILYYVLFIYLFFYVYDYDLFQVIFNLLLRGTKFGF